MSTLISWDNVNKGSGGGTVLGTLQQALVDQLPNMASITAQSVGGSFGWHGVSNVLGRHRLVPLRCRIYYPVSRRPVAPMPRRG